VAAFLWSSDMTGHTFVGDERPDDRAQSFVELIYASSDGHLAVSAYTDVAWRGLCAALERPDWLEDPRFRTAEGREVHKNERLELTQSVLETASTAHWIERLEAHDVPCAPVLTRTQMIRHPQIAANGILWETEHPQAGPIRQARQPARFAGLDDRPGDPAQPLGQDTRAALEIAGYAPAEIDRLFADAVAGPEQREAAE